MRRHTDMPTVLEHPSMAVRSNSDPHIDMDLAYGELPPPHPSDRYREDNEDELKEKASKLTMLLDEANCLQHSVTTIIDNLQNNPDALAAVALTLAEISALVGKMGPGVLPILKGSFPAVAALLLSPHFMIAAGVGIGVTIVALGGYKIIKKIQAQGDNAKPMAMGVSMEEESIPMEELEELETQELSRIEVWRRGIADAAEVSGGSTVDGEFITPGATRQLVAAGVLDEEDIKSRRKSRMGDRDDKERRSSKSHRAKSVKTSASKSKSKDKESSSKKKKEPSSLRSIFRSSSH